MAEQHATSNDEMRSHVLLVLQILLFYAEAINPGCDCIRFTSTFGKDYGIFSSPDYPKPYQTNIDCLLYTFVAAPDEIVEITFKDFDIQKQHLECVRGDFLKVFLHLEHGEVNEYTPSYGLLCGGMADIPHVLYSSDSGLVLEFHSGRSTSNSSGFLGHFRFINRRQFRTDGQKLPGTMCDHQFLSSNFSPTHGRFYSPRYPSNYPKNVRCAYRLLARNHERVRVVFEEVSLQKGDLSCLNRADIINVHDGRTVAAPAITVLCNELAELEVLSTGTDLYIEFIANSNWPGQGFKASFQFETVEPIPEVSSNDLDRTGRFSNDNGPAVSATMPTTSTEETTTTVEDTTPNPRAMPKAILCPRESSCDEIFRSDVAKNGSLSSPMFPKPYPSRSQCRYDFQGRGKERVQVVFSDFNLHHTSNENRECDTMDSLNAYVLIEGRMEKIDTFCGSTIPKPIMSNGPKLMLQFMGMYSSRAVRGFKATYAFLENFGVTSGKQVPEYPCGFAFNSNESRNGTFTSPNFPGFYPRNTECHYFFNGVNKERVHLNFSYFDVEGVSPCESISASDYVEFSNFVTTDRKYGRHCGQLKSFTISSDKKFFRVTFRSNDRLDGTGFLATYKFADEVDFYTHRQPTWGGGGGSTSSEAVSHTTAVLMAAATFIFLC